MGNKKILKIRIKSPAVSIKNGMIAETHSIFNTQSIDNKDADTATYGIRRIANNVAVTISPWTLLGHLRSGVTEYLISQGISVCHGMDLTNVSKNEDYVDMVDHDLEHGYHRKRMGDGNGNKNEMPECEAVHGKPCIVAEMFGGFTSHHRVFSLMPVKVTPVKSQYRNDVRNITGLGNFRNLAIAPRAAVDQNPYTFYNVDVVANLDTIMYLRMYEDNPLHVAMLMRAVEFLNQRTEDSDYNHQLGGARTFGCGWVQSEFLPPDLTRDETITHHMNLISREEAVGNELEADSKSPEDVKEEPTGKAGVSKKVSAKFEAWKVEKAQLDKDLDAKLLEWKSLFGTEKKWWSQKATWLRKGEKKNKEKA